MKRYCPIGNTSFISGYSCVDYAEADPHEVARMMGYEVVEKEQFREATKKKEANMDKPLKDWTLGEIKNYCEKHDCTKDCPCSASNGECKINRVNPCEWDLEEKPRFTEQEVEDAKAIKRLLTEYTGVKRIEHQWGTNLLLTSEESEEFAIEPKLFPSIKPGQSYTLDEIIRGAK